MIILLSLVIYIIYYLWVFSIYWSWNTEYDLLTRVQKDMSVMVSIKLKIRGTHPWCRFNQIWWHQISKIAGFVIWHWLLIINNLFIIIKYIYHLSFMSIYHLFIIKYCLLFIDQGSERHVGDGVHQVEDPRHTPLPCASSFQLRPPYKGSWPPYEATPLIMGRIYAPFTSDPLIKES